MATTDHTRARTYSTFHCLNFDLSGGFVNWNVDQFYTEILSRLQHTRYNIPHIYTAQSMMVRHCRATVVDSSSYVYVKNTRVLGIVTSFSKIFLRKL